MLLSNTAEREKCCFAPYFIKPLQKQIGVAFDPVLLRTPLILRDALPERTHVVVVFEIDSKGVSHDLGSFYLECREQVRFHCSLSKKRTTP